MPDERKKELFPFFAYIYSQQINPEKYGKTESFEEWADLLEGSEEDVNTIIEAAANLTDEEWEGIERQFGEETSEVVESEAIPEEEPEIQVAKKGAKMQHLKKLQSYNKGKKVSSYGKGKSMRKCACGCEMIDVKEDGGKMSSKCSCGCGGTMKKQEGGNIPEKKEVSDKIKKLGGKKLPKTKKKKVYKK